jgi:hypothetical protein
MSHTAPGADLPKMPQLIEIQLLVGQQYVVTHLRRCFRRARRAA